MPKDTIKLILFDIGGVLIEYGKVFETVAKEQNFPHELIDKTFDKYDKEITNGKITPQKLYETCLDENCLTADRDYDFVSSWIKDYDVIRPTYELLLSLNNIYKVGLFSNIYKNMVSEMIKKNVLPDINYDYFFLSCDVGMQKPDKEAYEHVLSVTNLNPNEILFVDDKEENLEPAVNLGWNTFKFNRQNPKESVSELQKILSINIQY